MSKMKFELLSGRHSNSSGNFKVGDIIESHGDLEKAFKLKFRRRHDLENIQGGAAVAQAAEDDETPPVRKVLAKPVVKPAKIINVAPSKTVPGEDEKPAPVATTPAPKADEAPADEDAAPPAVADPAPSPFGKDVTAQFKAAKSGNFAVFQSPKGFFLVDKSEPTESINEKPLKDTAAVEKMILKLTQ